MGCNTSSLASVKQSALSNGQKLQQNIATIRLSNRPITKSIENAANTIIKSNETVEQRYKYLDEQIYLKESQCPGSRLATIEAWVDFLKMSIENDNYINLNGQNNNNYNYNNNNNGNDEQDNSINSSINVLRNALEKTIRKDKTYLAKLTLQMGILTDVKLAEKNEEFFASISRNSTHEYDKYLKCYMLAQAKKRVIFLSESFMELRHLYVEHDGLIASITGGTYTSLIEQTLDDELEIARQMRDKLGSVAEQWKTAGYLLRASAKSAVQGCEYYTLIDHSSNETEIFSLALECRNSIQGSLIAFDAVQKVLPLVEIRFVTPRQVAAVQYANIYILTDIVNQLRYRHTNAVFQIYAENVKKSVEWFHNLFINSIQKDLQTAEETVLQFANKLRQERIETIKQYQIGNNLYVPSVAIVHDK